MLEGGPDIWGRGNPQIPKRQLGLMLHIVLKPPRIHPFLGVIYPNSGAIVAVRLSKALI